MNHIISFALGSIWRWSDAKNRNSLLFYAKKLNTSGIELTFSTKEELYSFKVSENNKLWLKDLDYVSIHAPFKLMKKSENDEEIIKQLTIITKLYNEFNAKNVIIHPEELPLPEILDEFDVDVSTENLPPKNHISICDLRKIFYTYPNISLCLDVSHAYRWSKYETGNLIEAFKNKISQIHLSGTYKNKEHQSLRNVTKEFIFSIQPIKKLHVPIVIEEDTNIKNLKFIKDEIKYIRNFFD